MLQGAQEADKTGTNRPQGTRSVLEIPLFLNAPDLGPNGVADAYALDFAGGTALVPGDRGRWTWLLEAAAAATGMGLDEREALRGITEMPAWSLGVQHRVGTLSPGKDADFVALSAGPLDPATSVDSVWIDGDLVFSQKEEQVEGGTVLRAGTVWTGSGAPLLGGAEVLLRDGKVVAVGARVPHPEGARIVDAGSDAHITPGFIDAHGSLGMNGRVDSSTTIGLMTAGSLWNPTWRSLARAGITTMVPSHSNWGVDGFRTQAVKTAAGVPSEAFVQGRHVVFFDWSGGDHVTRQSQFQRSLNAGKKYFDSWEEYRKKRAEWKASSGERASTERVTRESELRQRLAGTVLAEKEEEEEEVVEEEEEEVEKEVDPINGLWEATIEHAMIPEPINVNVRISHDGPRAILLLSSPDFPEEPGEEVEATWEPPRLIFQEESEIGTISIVGEVDSPDHMNVSVDAAGMISLEFEAYRIEVGESGDAAVVSRKRVKKDDGPQPPAVDPRREGWRALFEQRAVAVVKVQRQDEAERAIALFQKHELPFHLTGFGSGLGLEQTLADEGIGVVVPASLLSREKGRDQVTAAYFQEAGVRTAFQSGTAGGGARLLPRRMAMAVRHGLGAEQALESLTSGAADMLGLQGSVGRLNPGLDGDLILHSGPPFDLRSEILGVWVNGEEVPE